MQRRFVVVTRYRAHHCFRAGRHLLEKRLIAFDAYKHEGQGLAPSNLGKGCVHIPKELAMALVQIGRETCAKAIAKLFRHRLGRARPFFVVHREAALNNFRQRIPHAFVQARGWLAQYQHPIAQSADSSQRQDRAWAKRTANHNSFS